MTAPLERWIWVELIGFDHTAPDYGVADCLAAAGFTPNAVCLLVSSPDFVLQHEGLETERALPPAICSREGHTHNRQRSRQVWTNHQVRGLVAALQAAGVSVHLSFFVTYFSDRHHREWASDHLELLSLYNHADVRGGLNVLKRFADGAWFEDLFIDRVTTAVVDYGFDGWHGPDGQGPLSGPIYNLEFSDDLLDQFEQDRGIRLPAEVWDAGETTAAGRRPRADHLWRHHRRDWITFWADRWARFWGKMTARLHSLGKQAVMNSAWTRAPWEALYRYGVDYRKFAAAGVDAMIVETCAASLNLDPRPSTRDPVRSYDMTSMLGLMRAYLPDMKLIYLETVMDVVEQWDALRHTPTVLERELFNVNNVYQTRHDGTLRRAADGGLVCLGDGLTRRDWEQLNGWLDLARGPVPARVVGATLVWSDAAVDAQIDDFTRWRTLNTHRLLFRLQELGAPVQTVVRTEDLAGAEGPLLVLNPHLFTAEERERLAAYDRGPVVRIGPELDQALFSDRADVRPLHCAVAGCDATAPVQDSSWETTNEWPADDQGVIDSFGYWDRLTVRPVSDGFLRACCELIWEVVGGLGIEEEREAVTGLFMELPDGTWRVALRNKFDWYATPTVTVRGAIERATVRTEYPLVAVRPDGNTFRVRVPGKGLTVVDLVLAGP